MIVLRFRDGRKCMTGCVHEGARDNKLSRLQRDAFKCIIEISGKLDS